MDNTKTKSCLSCGIEKPLTEFHRVDKKYRKDGLHTYCKKCRSIKAKEWSERNPLSGWQKNLRASYNLSIDQYEEMSISQNGACAICGKAEESTYRGKIRRLAVDHCHTTNTNRGLLCFKCNAAIGCMEDNIDIMASAISYLQQDYSGQAQQPRI